MGFESWSSELLLLHRVCLLAAKIAIMMVMESITLKNSKQVPIKCYPFLKKKKLRKQCKNLHRDLHYNL